MALYNGLDKKLGLRDMDFTGGTNPSGLPDPSTAGPYTARNARQAIGQDSGAYVVTAADVTATKSTITTVIPLASFGGLICQISRAGSIIAPIGNQAAAITLGVTDPVSFTVQSSGTYTLTAGDVVYFIVLSV